jgi:hypothetical protein
MANNYRKSDTLLYLHDNCGAAQAAFRPLRHRRGHLLTLNDRDLLLFSNYSGTTILFNAAKGFDLKQIRFSD